MYCQSFHTFQCLLPFYCIYCIYDASGDREGEDTDHDSTATGLTGSGGGGTGTAGGIGAGTGTLTGAGGAARRVAPSVLGASRRSSLSAPLRVLPRPPREEEGYDEGSAVKRR